MSLTIDPSDPLPLYHQIHEQLRRQIVSGVLKSGDSLPGESQICAETGVSRMTARQALVLLASERLVVRQRGRGTFVAPPEVVRIRKKDSLHPHNLKREKTSDERDELVFIIRELYGKNLITTTGGNLSLRLAGDSSQLWITPSSTFKGNLRPQDMLRIDLEGRKLDREAGPPSSEHQIHTEILKARPDLNAVIHTHAPWATLLVLTETPFLPISSEAAFIGEIPRVPFIMPGSLELAQAVTEALGETGSAVLMQNHGLVVAGTDLRRAASTSEVIERCAELILRCMLLGRQPPTLPEGAIRRLQKTGQMMA